MNRKHILPAALILVFLLFMGCKSDDNDIAPSNADSENPATPDPEALISIDVNGELMLDFGKRVPGRESVKTLMVENTGDAILEVSSINLPNGYVSDWNNGNISAGNLQEVTITFNPSEVKSYEGTLEVISNAKNDKDNIGLLGVGVSEIFDGSIALGNQNDVNDFGAIGYTQVTGTLCIGLYCEVEVFEPNVVDLTPLSNLSSVTDLRVGSNAELESLEGLNNIKVEHYLSILFNPNLKDLDVISEMPFSVLPVGLHITGNTSIENIDGLQKITSIANFLTISENDKLQNIDGLSNLISVDGRLTVNKNPLITNLNGLSSVEIVGNTITIRENEALYDFCGIKMLLEIGGYSESYITTKYNRYNPSIDDIVQNECEYAVPSDTYYGNLALFRQNDIDLVAAHGFSKIIGDLTFNGFEISSTSLTFENFSSLTEITGSLVIINTEVLENLNGFENLNRIGGNIDISRNSGLSNFCGIVSVLQTTNGFSGNYTVQDNLFNPTQQELENGTCSQ